MTPDPDPSTPSAPTAPPLRAGQTITIRLQIADPNAAAELWTPGAVVAGCRVVGASTATRYRPGRAGAPQQLADAVVDALEAVGVAARAMVPTPGSRPTFKAALAALKATAGGVRFLTETEAASRAGVDRVTLGNWIRAGQLEAERIQVGRFCYLRIRADRLRAFLEARDRAPSIR